MDTNTAATATTTPERVLPWVTVWDSETFIASIAGGKVHTVTRKSYSDNREMNVADANARREDTYTTACGTTRRGRYLAVDRSDVITCTKCAKAAAK